MITSLNEIRQRKCIENATTMVSPTPPIECTHILDPVEPTTMRSNNMAAPDCIFVSTREPVKQDMTKTRPTCIRNVNTSLSIVAGLTLVIGSQSQPLLAFICILNAIVLYVICWKLQS
jgi:hypothetical protein